MPPPLGALPVPATPSLIKALDRIAVAQKDVFGSMTHSPHFLQYAVDTSGQQRHHPRSRDGLPRVHDTPLSDDDDEGDHDLESTGMKMRVTKPQGRRRGWDEFWSDVKNKARQ